MVNMAEFNMYNTSNYSINTFPDHTPSPWIVSMKIMRSVCIPLIVGIGLLGNTLCLIVFLTKNMRKSSCSIFLASLAFADDSYLICLLLTWIDGDVKSIMTTNLACQLLFFFTYVTSFLNAWFIVGFTCERFIAICLPLRSNYMCSVYREKVAVCALCVSAVIAYSFSFWTIGITNWGSEKRCSHLVKYFDFLTVITWLDLFMTMLIPFMVIVCINAAVLRTVIKGTLAARNQQMMTRVKINACNSEQTFISNGHSRPHVRLTGVQRSMSQVRVARTLFLVSTAFLILNLPSHTIRLYHLIDTTTSDDPQVSIEFYFFQELTLMLYHTTFSCNFVLYTLFGRNFKNSLILLLRCKSSAKIHKQKMLHKLSSTQGACMTNM